MKIRRRGVDDDYFDFVGNGIFIGDAHARAMSNAEKAAARKREAKRVPIGFQVPKKRRR